MSRIKIGQIGVSHSHAGVKMQALRNMPDTFEVVGVVDDRQSDAARFAGDDLRPYEGLGWLTEDELFNVPGLQAVAVETANADLVATALKCMERGFAMHMDKPGGDDFKLFEQLRRGCEARRIPFQMGYMFRNNPAMQWCLKAARNGWLGEIFEFQANMSHDYGGDAYQKYVARFQGGTMFYLGCHFIDLIVSMLGRPLNVLSFLKTAPNEEVVADNNCLAVLEYPHALASVQVSSREIGGLNRRRLKICGRKGTVELSPLERFDKKPLLMSLILAEAVPGYEPGEHTLDFGVKHDRYEDQLLEFAGMIKGDVKTQWTCEHDCLAQEVLLAAAGYKQWNS